MAGVGGGGGMQQALFPFEPRRGRLAALAGRTGLFSSVARGFQPCCTDRLGRAKKKTNRQIPLLSCRKGLSMLYHVSMIVNMVRWKGNGVLTFLVIDEEPSDFNVQQARKLVEKALEGPNELHPGVAPLKASFLSDEIEDLVEKSGKGENMDAIDMSRYSNLYEETGEINVDRVMTALIYTQYRQENLEMLARYGKNPWLISNDATGHDLAALELELNQLKEQENEINVTRKRKQLELQPTLNYLSSRWQSTIRGLVDVNVANLKLEREIKRLRGE